MEDIFKNLSEPSWWISVVIVGLLVNLLGAYGKPLIDKSLARYSSSRRQKQEAKRAGREKLVNELIADRIKLIDKKLDTLDSSLVGVFFAVTFIAGLLTIREVLVTRWFLIILYPLMLLMVIGVILSLGRNLRMRLLLKEVEDNRARHNEKKETKKLEAGSDAKQWHAPKYENRLSYQRPVTFCARRSPGRYPHFQFVIFDP